MLVGCFAMSYLNDGQQGFLILTQHPQGFLTAYTHHTLNACWQTMCEQEKQGLDVKRCMLSQHVADILGLQS